MNGGDGKRNNPWLDRPVGGCDDLLISGENEDIRNDRRPMEEFSRNRNSNGCLIKVVGMADGQNFSDSLNADCRMAMIYGYSNRPIYRTIRGSRYLYDLTIYRMTL